MLHLPTTQYLSLEAAVLVAFVFYILYSETRYMRMRLRHERELHAQQLASKEAQVSIMRDFLMKHIGIAQKMEAIIHQPEQRVLLTGEDWKQLEVFLDSVDNMFVTRLRTRFPNLSQRDVQLFMLLRLRMPARSLAMIYGISEKSVKQKLFLYKSKIGLESRSLREYIENFDTPDIMQDTTFKLRLSRTSILLTIVVYAAMFGGACLASHETILAAVFTLVLAFIVSLGGLYFTPLSISCGAQAITLRFALRRKTFMWDDIARTEPYHSGCRLLRTFGSGGFLGWWGWFHSRDLGHVFVYASDLSHLLYIEMRNGRKYLVSCPEAARLCVPGKD